MRRLLAAHRVLEAAPGVLHLAGGLFGLAFAFELGVAGHLAGHFLDLAFGLVGRAFDAGEFLSVERRGALARNSTL